MASTQESFIKLWDNRISSENKLTSKSSDSDALPQVKVLKHEDSFESDNMSSIGDLEQKEHAFEYVDKRHSLLSEVKDGWTKVDSSQREWKETDGQESNALNRSFVKEDDASSAQTEVIDDGA